MFTKFLQKLKDLVYKQLFVEIEYILHRDKSDIQLNNAFKEGNQALFEYCQEIRKFKIGERNDMLRNGKPDSVCNILP